MPIERYFYSGDLAESCEIFLENDEHHHLAKVTRGRVGENVEVVNGSGKLAYASINSIQKQKTGLFIDKVISEKSPAFSLILYQAIPRFNRLETIIEKATELGVAEIILFPSERSEKKEFSDNQMSRLINITIAAIKQSGRLHIPKITLTFPIKQWAVLKDVEGYYGDVRPEALPLVDALEKGKGHNHHLAFCIGPESGFTQEETNLLEQKGFSGIKLHQNILRTDTAAIAALSIASYYLK